MNLIVEDESKTFLNFSLLNCDKFDFFFFIFSQNISTRNTEFSTKILDIKKARLLKKINFIIYKKATMALTSGNGFDEAL